MAPQPVDAQLIGDDAAHRHARVERGVGVLEDDLDPAAEGSDARRSGADELFAVKGYRARRGVQESQYHPACRGFAAPRLADQGNGLAVSHVEADTGHGVDMSVHSAQQAGADREVPNEVSDLENLVATPR